MRIKLDGLLDPKRNEPITTSMSVPLTESDWERANALKVRAKKQLGRNVLPSCMRQAFRSVMDELEARLDQLEETAG